MLLVAARIARRRPIVSQRRQHCSVVEEGALEPSSDAAAPHSRSGTGRGVPESTELCDVLSDAAAALSGGRVSRELRHPGSEDVGVVPIARDGRGHRRRVLPDDSAGIEPGERGVPGAQPWTEATVQVEVPPATGRVGVALSRQGLIVGDVDQHDVGDTQLTRRDGLGR